MEWKPLLSPREPKHPNENHFEQGRFEFNLRKIEDVEKKALRIDENMKTPDFKRKTVKKTHEPEKHTSVDKKKRKTTYEKEKHSHAKVSQITENKR